MFLNIDDGHMDSAGCLVISSNYSDDGVERLIFLYVIRSGTDVVVLMHRIRIY